MTENVLRRVVRGTHSDLLGKVQVIGRLDQRATARVVCQDGDCADLQAEGPGNNRMACLMVGCPAGVSLVFRHDRDLCADDFGDHHPNRL